jgi:hypothetical protein
MKYALLVLSVLAFGLAVYSQMQVSELKIQNETLTTQIENLEKVNIEEEYELAVAMGRMQVYFSKLWFAGSFENWELADFYAHELEETLEEIISREIYDEGMNISSLTKVMTNKPFHELEKAVKSREITNFLPAYDKMLRTCNACHQSSKHNFINIKTPESVPFDNQVFKLKE